MKKKNLTKSLIVLISAAVFVVCYKTANSCGPSIIPDDYYSIFDKSVFNLPALKPFFLSEYVFADQDENGEEKSKFDNLKEWLSFLNNEPSIDDIEKLIYTASPEDLKKAEEYLKSGKSSLLPASLKNNSMLSYIHSKKAEEAFNYILYAKECETESARVSPWEEIKRDSLHIEKLLAEGIKRQPAATSSFIKNRYAYQIVRMAHYLKQYEKTIEYFDRYFPQNGKKDLIFYWSLSHKAGALSSLNKKAEANLIFTEVFDRCPSRQKQSLLSVSLLSDSLFKATLALCSDNHIKAALNAVTGYKNPAYALDAIKEIYTLEPASDYLELLLSRETTRFERTILPSREIWGGYKSYLETREPENKTQGLQLFDITARIARERKIKNPWLWNFAAGYLATLLNKDEVSNEFYASAKKMCPKENLFYVRKIQIAEFVAYVNSLKHIDPGIEDELAVKLNWLKNLGGSSQINIKDAEVYIMNLLARKFSAQKDIVKMHLCLGARINYSEDNNYENFTNVFGYDLRSDYNNEPIDQLLNTLAEREKQYNQTAAKTTKAFTPLEKYLLENYMYSLRDLAEIKAKWHIARGNFESALEMLKKGYYFDNTYDGSEKLPADPFMIHIRDCHDCDYLAVNTNRYTLVSFSKKMAELKNLAEKSGDKQAEYCFEYANGLYNKSYYGNCWKASAFYRTSWRWGHFPGFYSEFYDCSEAASYYLKAASLTRDREFSAKCVYMAAKCEQNAYYNSPGFTDEAPVPASFRMSFKNLAENYKETKYYNELIKECTYFKEFTGN